jgi:hypothetical protein
MRSVLIRRKEGKAMALTDAGKNFLAAIAIGETVTPFNAANAYMGVGDSATAFSAAQTDLLGTNKLRKAMTSGFPTRSGNTISFSALFGTSEANFAWNEWGMFNGATGNTMLNRKAESRGTKTSAQSWQFSVDVAVNNP